MAYAKSFVKTIFTRISRIIHRQGETSAMKPFPEILPEFRQTKY